MVGSALVRRFKKEPGFELLLRDRKQLDLTVQASVEAFLAAEKPDVAIIAAARVGGIHANSTFPAEFLDSNLAIALSTVHGAWKAGVKRLLFLGSSCIYPKHAAQPMTEDCLLTGALEATNEAYAIAKIAGLKLCQYYRKQYGVVYHSAMPTNLYGPGDNYHPKNSHVLPALIRRFDGAREAAAPEVVAWGSGMPRREFLHVDDLADACAFLLGRENPPDWINVGTGTDVTIRELTGIVAEATGYKGRISWDTTMPDGTPRKLLDVSRLSAMGWKARVGLREGVASTYQSFLAEKSSGVLRV
jgi:GDP-L-fucose synthase